jgi:hypothetical protein
MTTADAPLAPRPAAAAGAATGRGRLDPRRLRSWVVRAALPVVLVGVLVFYLCFGMLRVPAGMDTIARIPPGAWCLIDKRAGSVRVGSAVFVDLPAGGTLLSRVTAIDEDGSLRVANDNPDSALPDSDQFGPLPAACLRGVVLVVFGGDGPPGERIDGR